MKIIGGVFKGRNFYMPADIRPTQNIVRKSVFDMLSAEIEGARFLDLFAGSGAMGIEAISRGALKVVLVEHNPRVIEIIDNSLARFFGKNDEQVGSIEVINQDVSAAIKAFARAGDHKFELIFCDPPYGLALAKKALKTLGAHDILTPNSQVIIQSDVKEILPANEGILKLLRQRKFGSTILSIYRK